VRFLAVNEAAVLHYGFSQKEFLGMTLEEIAIALGQSVKTVQRWHARGMPVYRNPHVGHVWAYLDELVGWRDNPVSCDESARR
jgi:hypothetical protein